jgi:hypothetical protein
VDQELVPDRVDVELGAECLLPGDPLGAFVDDRADVPVEGPAVEVPLDEVLLQLGTDPLEQEAQVPDDRVVAQDRVPPLHDVGDPDDQQDPEHAQEHPPRRGPDRRGQHGERPEHHQGAEDEEREHVITLGPTPWAPRIGGR